MSGWDWGYMGPAVALWGAVAAIGGVVGYFAVKAWRKERGRSLAALSLGFLLISVGSAATWFALFFGGMGIFWCDMGSTAVTAGGLGSVAFALGTRR